MGKFTEYKVQLKGLADGEHVVNYHLGGAFFANMENPDIREADLDVVLTIKVRGEHYELNFAIVGTVTTLCDRCLDDLEIPIDTSFKIYVEYGDDYNDDADDLLVIPRSDSYLNVAYMIYDTVVLAMPIKKVHPMGKCNRQMSALLRKHRATPQGEDAELENELIDGIDDVDAGRDDSSGTDPRWDALRNINTDD